VSRLPEIIKKPLRLPRAVLMTGVNRVRIALGRDSNDEAVDYWAHIGDDEQLTDVQVDGFVSRGTELAPILDELREDVIAHVQAHMHLGSRVLDYGCGSGRYLSAFADTRGIELYGLDLSASILERFTRKRVPNAHLVQADLASDDSFVNENGGSFDVVCCVSVIQYVRYTRLPRLIRAMAALLRPGGAVYLRFPHPNSRWERLSEFGYVRYYPREIEGLLAESGLTVTESYSTHYGVRADTVDRTGNPNYGYVVVAEKPGA